MVQTLGGNWASWLVPLTLLCLAVMIPVVRSELGVKKPKNKEKAVKTAEKIEVINAEDSQGEDELTQVVVMAAAAYMQMHNKFGGKTMKNLKITVNGKTYDVTVEEENSYAPRYNAASTVRAAAPAAAPAAEKKTATPTAAPVAAPVAEKKTAPSDGTGNKVEAPMSGRIVEIVAKVGSTVKVGDCIVVMEAMKLQSEVCSDFEGIVKEINVSEKQDVSTGDVIAVIG